MHGGDLNPRPPLYEKGALSTELRARLWWLGLFRTDVFWRYWKQGRTAPNKKDLSDVSVLVRGGLTVTIEGDGWLLIEGAKVASQHVISSWTS
jgi:hypothetical protein